MSGRVVGPSALGPAGRRPEFHTPRDLGSQLEGRTAVTTMQPSKSIPRLMETFIVRALAPVLLIPTTPERFGRTAVPDRLRGRARRAFLAPPDPPDRSSRERLSSTPFSRAIVVGPDDKRAVTRSTAFLQRLRDCDAGAMADITKTEP
jgi:hypothetical protein